MTTTHEVGQPSHDGGLSDLVAVLDRLRSPGGCPWYAQQTHRTLARYAVEEAHELADALAGDDRDHLVEELGDVLLQVVLHARLGQEHPTAPFDLDEVASGIAAKLRRRNPHVFGADARPVAVAEVEERWEALKAAEKSHRTGLLDGIPASLPALALATKAADRLERTGRADLLEPSSSSDPSASGGAARTPDDEVGEALLAIVVDARRTGVDPEAALRRVVSRAASAADRGTR